MARFPPGKGGGEEVAWGYKGKGVTVHSWVEGHGLPLALQSTPANASEPAQVIPLLDAVQVRTGRRGRSRKRPKCLQMDANYDVTKTRRQVRQRGIQPLISQNPRRRKHPKLGRPRAVPVDRWKVERCFAWLQRKFRRLACRWERRNRYWLGFLSLAFSLVWLNVLLG